jgi:hypothetical protein
VREDLRGGGKGYFNGAVFGETPVEEGRGNGSCGWGLGYSVGEEDIGRGGRWSKCTVEVAFMLFVGRGFEEGSQCVGLAGVEYDWW